MGLVTVKISPMRVRLKVFTLELAKVLIWFP